MSEPNPVSSPDGDQHPRGGAYAASPAAAHPAVQQDRNNSWHNRPRNEFVADYTRAKAAAFPGSGQAQRLPWSVVTQTTSYPLDERPEKIPTGSGSGGDFWSYFYATVYHSDFDPEWPISTDWPAVIRGLRGSFSLSQTAFADMLQVGRATVERWEAGTSLPFGGDPLQMLTLVQDHVATPVQAGQTLNLAAAAVLPHVLRPTAEYRGRDLVEFLVSGKHDHRYLGPVLLDAMVTARILVPLQEGSDELDEVYFPLAARLQPNSSLPDWAPPLIDMLIAASDTDRQLVLNLAARLDRRTA